MRVAGRSSLLVRAGRRHRRCIRAALPSNPVAMQPEEESFMKKPLAAVLTAAFVATFAMSAFARDDDHGRGGHRGGHHRHRENSGGSQQKGGQAFKGSQQKGSQQQGQQQKGSQQKGGQK